MLLKGAKSEIDVKVTAEVEIDNGKTMRVPFVCRYRKLPVNEARDLLERVASEGIGDEDLMRDHLVDWKGLEDADGDTVEFNADNLETVMQVREYRQAIVGGFMQVLMGRKALEKN